MSENLIRSLKRFGRAAVSIFVAGLIAITQEDPKWIAFAPLLQFVGKYLRAKWGIKYIPF